MSNAQFMLASRQAGHKGGGRTVWPDKVVLSHFEPLVFSRFVGLHRFTTVVACSAVSAADVVVSLLAAACVVVVVAVAVFAPSACACKIIINVLLMSCDY